MWLLCCWVVCAISMLYWVCAWVIWYLGGWCRLRVLVCGLICGGLLWLMMSVVLVCGMGSIWRIWVLLVCHVLCWCCWRVVLVGLLCWLLMMCGRWMAVMVVLFVVLVCGCVVFSSFSSSLLS